MTTKIRAVHAALVLVLAGLVGMAWPAAARAADNDKLVADIPFEFRVAGETLPAGTYRIELGPGRFDPAVLAIQTASESRDELRFRKVYASTTPASPVTAEGQPRLVFQRVGDLYFLEKVVPPTGTVEKVR